MSSRLEVEAPDGVGEVEPGADLADLLLSVCTPRTGDIVTVTSKVVSKAEGRFVVGTRDDALPGETVRVVARRGQTTIVRNRQGLTMAAAGIDASNVTPGRVLLLPEDPDASARRLREAVLERLGANVGVLVTDTAGRAWREGQTDIAIGASGVVVAEDYAGRTDGHGNPLLVTAPAVADELAGAAELASGKLGGRPFAVIRGRADLVLPAGEHGTGAAALVRADGGDLFGFGSREAVVAALAGRDTAVFGAPAEAGDLVRALQEVAGPVRVTSPDAGDDNELAAYLPGGGPADRRLIEVLVRVFGWTVEEAGDGGDALDLRFRRNSP